MFKHWFTPLDQSLEAMVSRYTTAGAVRHEMPRFRSHDARMLFFARQAMKGAFFKALAEEIRRDGHAGLNDPCTITEFTWLLFSLKDWKRLVAAIEDKAPHHRLPGHVADLYFLATYRLNWDVFAKGADPEKFRNTVPGTVDFIRRHWPDDAGRADLFAALVRNSLGDFHGARSRIADLSQDLALIPPLAAARSFLPRPASRDATPWPLEIRKAARSKATIASVDRVYYERFAPAFLAIHSLTNPDRGVHFHCVGFDPREIDDALHRHEAVGFTIDHTDISGLAPRDRRGYYACARLMHAIAYLDVYEDILISDIDGSVDISASDVLSESPRADVVIKSKITDFGQAVFNFPWSIVPAAANIIRNTEGGTAFARYLRDYLSHIFFCAQKKERPLWFADQCALFYAYTDLKDEVEFMNCKGVLYNQGRDWSLFSGEAAKAKYLEEALRNRNIPT